jgi:gliding motility-associated-like protein
VSKDLFEIKIKEQLSNAKATVPKGAWEAIKSQVPTAGAATVSTGSIGSFGFGFGMATGVAILASLGVYSELKEEGSIEQKSVETARVEMNESLETKTEERTDVIDFNEAEKSVEVEEQNSSPNQANGLEESITAQSTDIASPSEENSDKPVSQNTPEVALTPANTIDSSELAEMNDVTATDDRDPVMAQSGTPSVEVSEDFKAEIMTTSREGYAPLTLKLHNSGNSGESVWDIDGKTSKGNIVETTFDEAGTYNVYLTVYDEEGNIQAEDQIEIWVKEGSDIKLPNIFTPNGDGLNDTYRIGYAKNIKDFYIQISDETGRVVYTSTDTAKEWVYDQNPGTNNRRYTVQYRAIGEDGKVHTDQFPLIIVTD